MTIRHDACVCQTASSVESDEALQTLADVRAGCPVLNQIILPNSVWPDFQAWHRQPDGVDFHRSVSLLALERGCLGRLTSPVHRYLIEGGSIRQDARQQYINDLQERWMQYTDPIERHHKSSMFQGRVVELQYAEWLEMTGRPITGLEALGASSDVESTSIEGTTTAFEVKFIGSEDNDFTMIMKSIAGLPAVGFVSPYRAINYLLFRAYEAAKQLAHVNGERIATVIVDDFTWWRFEAPLAHRWIDWANPHFIGEDSKWLRFMANRQQRYPQLPADVPSTLHEVDAVWVLRQSSSFEFSVAYEITMRSA